MASSEPTRAVIEAIFRDERARIIARLCRITKDVELAEELAQDACVAALEAWSARGIPAQPGAWLMACAKNGALDQWRRQRMAEPKRRALAALVEADAARPSIEDTLDEDVGDDLLRLIFLACHPALSMDAQVALTLRLLCGLSTDEIARAFLVEEPAIAQRIVRAKRALSAAGARLEMPHGEAREARLGAVLRVIYLVFNEGYAATGGERVLREELCEQALRLGRTLLSLMPVEPEAHALTALMELHAARFATRVDARGAPVLLLDQDRRRWDQAAITRGLLALTRAHVLGGRGPYVLQAEIAACHARARRAEDTDWPTIAARYAELASLTPSPVIELNRAIAVSMAEGAEAGLRLLDALEHERALEGNHRLHAARGDVLFRLERFSLAQRAFERAAALASHERERALLLERARACEDHERRASAASDEPLEICEGIDAEFVLRVKAATAMSERREERERPNIIRVWGKLAPWSRVLVRVAHRQKRSLRLFVLEPASTLNEIVAGPFWVRGHFAITHKVNNTKHVDAEWEARAVF